MSLNPQEHDSAEEESKAEALQEKVRCLLQKSALKLTYAVYSEHLLM